RHSLLYRSVLHEYLQGSWEAPQLQQRWRVGGEIYEGAQSSLRLNISEGAKAALCRRADILNTTATALMRTLMMEVFEGRYGQPGTLKYVTRRQMFDQMEQYYIPPMPEVE